MPTPTKAEAEQALDFIARKLGQHGMLECALEFQWLAEFIAQAGEDAERWRQVRSFDGNCALFEIPNADGAPAPFAILIGGHADEFVDREIAARSAAVAPTQLGD